MAGTGLVAVAQAVNRGERELKDVPEPVRNKVRDIAKVLKDNEPTLTPAPIPTKKSSRVRKAIIG